MGQDNQHREGYIAATEQGDSWDDFIFKEECKRDAPTEGPRVVETWHIGEKTLINKFNFHYFLEGTWPGLYREEKKNLKRKTSL